MKNRYLWGAAAVIFLSLAGCAKTPEKTAVVSKAGGMLENRTAEVLPEGEVRELDVPSHWKETLERGNGQVRIEADIDIDVPETGNIPVIELEQTVLTDEKLKELCSYFAQGKDLYRPGKLSKYQLIKEFERMKNKEGMYGDPYSAGSLSYMINNLEKLIEKAPEKAEDSSDVSLQFGPKWYWEKDWTDGHDSKDIDENDKKYFTAWIDNGKSVENDPFITAQSKGIIKRYSVGLQIENGGFTYEAADVLDEEAFSDLSLAGMKETSESDDVNHAKDFQAYVEKLEGSFSNPEITVEQAEKAAGQAIEALGIEGLSLCSLSRALIVPRDGRWNGIGEDLSHAETGYSLFYYRSGAGLDGYIQWNATISDGLPETSYAPPFQQECLAITVGTDGIKRFQWLNPAKKTAVVAENVSLIPFHDAAERLADHMLYEKAYSDDINGFDSTESQLRYEVENVKLCMVYANAYEKPENAWLVPAWVFEMRWYLNIPGQPEIKREIERCMINAIDGGYISPY